MPSYKDKDDRPKRSWRDIDKQKDGSQHRKPDRPISNPRAKARADSASKVYKSKLDAFFDGQGKAPAHVKEKLNTLKAVDSGGEKRVKALKAIKEASTSTAADKAVKAYLVNWELPPDYEVIGQVLTCSDEEYVELALTMMTKMLDDKQIPKRAALLEQRLRRVKTLADDPDLQDKADAVMRQLRLFS